MKRAAPPTIAGEKLLAAQEWRSYIEPLIPMGERMASRMSELENPQKRLELYRMLYASISQSYIGLLYANPDHPDFWPIWNIVYNFWVPNPDNSYYLTPIDEDGVYKITGYRGTVHMVDIGVGSGQFYAALDPKIPDQKWDKRPGDILADYDLDHLHMGKDGYFEVILSAERPAGYKGNWWQLGHKATYIHVRQVSYDWLHEEDARFAIERLDRPAIRPRQSAEEIDAKLRQIPQWVENWMLFMFDYFDNIYLANGLINKLSVRGMDDIGGVSTQKYVEGLFEINSDEALIYETELPEQCRYWNIQVSDSLWGALDHMNRQSTLNGHTAEVDKDGKFRAVISGTDPGVPNWLDTGGYEKGGIFGRWTECSSTPVPSLKKVKLSDVRRHLPPDTPMVSSAARDASIRLRRRGAQLRRRW